MFNFISTVKRNVRKIMLFGYNFNMIYPIYPSNIKNISSKLILHRSSLNEPGLKILTSSSVRIGCNRVTPTV